MHFQTKTFTSIVYATAIIFMFQSMLWICISICAVLTYRCVLPTPQYGNNSFVLTTIVKLWFQGDECTVRDDIPGYPNFHLLPLLKPADMFSWMVGYLTASILNFLISILLLTYKAKEQLKSVLSIWCFVALLTAIMDVILTILLILDYCEIKEHVKDDDDKENITVVPIAMFIASARGFGLWFINFALIVYFILWLKEAPVPQKKFQGRATTEHREPYIHGYDNFTFRSPTDDAIESHIKRNKRERGSTEESEVFRGQLFVSSYENVTPFNEEEYPPEPPRKPKTPRANQGHLKQITPCYCAEKQKGYSPNYNYHSHACPTLRSELEAKLETIRSKTDRAREKTKSLKDFSHDIRNFRQGTGRRKNQIVDPSSRPKVSTPAATTCANSDFY